MADRIENSWADEYAGSKEAFLTTNQTLIDMLRAGSYAAYCARRAVGVAE